MTVLKLLTSIGLTRILLIAFVRPTAGPIYDGMRECYRCAAFDNELDVQKCISPVAKGEAPQVFSGFDGGLCFFCWSFKGIVTRRDGSGSFNATARGCITRAEVPTRKTYPIDVKIYHRGEYYTAKIYSHNSCGYIDLCNGQRPPTVNTEAGWPGGKPEKWGPYWEFWRDDDDDSTTKGSGLISRDSIGSGNSQNGRPNDQIGNGNDGSRASATDSKNSGGSHGSGSSKSGRPNGVVDVICDPEIAEGNKKAGNGMGNNTVATTAKVQSLNLIVICTSVSVFTFGRAC